MGLCYRRSIWSTKTISRELTELELFGLAQDIVIDYCEGVGALQQQYAPRECGPDLESRVKISCW